MNFTRRNFLATAALSSASIALGSKGEAQPASQPGGGMPDMPDMTPQEPMTVDAQGHMHMRHPKPKRPGVPRLPALICRMTNTVGIDEAYDMLTKGTDPLEAALHLTSTQENDPNDFTNGLGGLPNQDGEIQLDAAVWHGPSRRAAAVASVSGIKNPALLARAVMQQTGYSLLTGSDAQRFALAHGFTKEDLATPRSQGEYAMWKELQKNPPQLKAPHLRPQLA